MPVYKTEAIVLRQQALGEADRIVTLFTREYGKLRAAAKGIRRPASRLGGRLEPFTHARLLLARGRTLDVIAQAEIVGAFAGVGAAPDAAGQAWGPARAGPAPPGQRGEARRRAALGIKRLRGAVEAPGTAEFTTAIK